jgi:Multiubiquitin
MTPTQNYQVQIDDKAYLISDPIVTGRQILETTRKKTVDEYLVFQELLGGQLEELRLEETIDVRKAGVEKFITQKSDRTFYFVVDGERRPWPLQFITGWEIKNGLMSILPPI